MNLGERAPFSSSEKALGSTAVAGDTGEGSPSGAFKVAVCWPDMMRSKIGVSLRDGDGSNIDREGTEEGLLAVVKEAVVDD